MAKEKLIEVTNLKQYFPVKKSSWFQKEQLYVNCLLYTSTAAVMAMVMPITVALQMQVKN